MRGKREVRRVELEGVAEASSSWFLEHYVLSVGQREKGERTDDTSMPILICCVPRDETKRGWV